MNFSRRGVGVVLGSASLGRRLTVSLLATVTIVVSGITTGAAANTADRTWNMRYSYTGRAPGALVVTGQMRAAGDALLALVTVDRTKPKTPTAYAAQVVDVGDQWPRTYGALGDRTVCAAPVACAVDKGVFRFSVAIDMDGTGWSRLAVYLIARGPGAEVNNDALGHWRPARRTSGVVDVYDGQSVDAGIDVGGNDVGAAVESTVLTPYRTSVAVAVPGCEVVGAGASRLEGGVQQPLAVCPSEPVAAVALNPTTWNVFGAAGGVTRNRSRLLVISG